MGFQFKIEAVERKILDKVFCDSCGKEVKKISDGGWNKFGEPMTMYHEPGFEDYFCLNCSWGYFSKKDGETHTAVICEACYDVIFKNVNMKVQEQ
jgi:hypothetical protein